MHPVIGRGFTAEESAWNGPKAALHQPLAVAAAVRVRSEHRRPDDHAQWRVDDGDRRAAGVVRFRLGVRAGCADRLFTPFPLTPETNRWGNTLSIVGRLKPGVTLAAAAAELKALVAADHERESEHEQVLAAPLSSLRDHVSGRTRSGFIVLAFAVGVVMLIVCANLSNLLLARATTRQKEMAIRAALGAGRRRLVRQMLTESVVLSSCGAVIGVDARDDRHARDRAHGRGEPAAASATSASTRARWRSPRCSRSSLDSRFGIAPALQISEARVHDALKASGRSATDGKRGQWMRRSLVVSEIALACVLLVGSGLLIRSFLKVLDVDLGFRPERVVAVRVDPDAARSSRRRNSSRISTKCCGSRDRFLESRRRRSPTAFRSAAIEAGASRAGGAGVRERKVAGRVHPRSRPTDSSTRWG